MTARRRLRSPGNKDSSIARAEGEPRSACAQASRGLRGRNLSGTREPSGTEEVLRQRPDAVIRQPTAWRRRCEHGDDHADCDHERSNRTEACDDPRHRPAARPRAGNSMHRHLYTPNAMPPTPGAPRRLVCVPTGDDSSVQVRIRLGLLPSSAMVTSSLGDPRDGQRRRSGQKPLAVATPESAA
jgi:hypothetical protein